MAEIKVQKVEYYRLVRAPTLKQFLIREMFKEAAEENNGVTGVSPDENRVLPDSAINMRNKLKGLKADKIAGRRPDLVEKWKRTYGRK